MTSEQWEDLAYLSMLECQNMLSPIGKDNHETLLTLTEEESEHPEDYDGPCACQLCCSYGD